MKPLNIIFLLLVVVAVVLGYFLFQSINVAPSPTSVPTANNQPGQAPTATSTPLPAQNPSEVSSLGIAVLEQNASNTRGGASLIENGEQTIVTLTMQTDSDLAMPAHIHKGTCPNPGEVVYPLEPVVNGTSTTTIDATIEELVASPMAVNVHKSADEANVYVACGDIVIP